MGVALGRWRRGLVFHVAEGFLTLLAVLRFGVGRILGIVFLIVGILLVLLLLRRIGFVGGLAFVVFVLLLVFILRLIFVLLVFFILILFLIVLFLVVVGLFQQGIECVAELGPIGRFGV